MLHSLADQPNCANFMDGACSSDKPPCLQYALYACQGRLLVQVSSPMSDIRMLIQTLRSTAARIASKLTGEYTNMIANPI